MYHAVYLPTDRPASPAIAECAQDAAAIAEVTGSPVPLVVVEHLDGEWATDHETTLQQASRDLTIPTVHLTRQRALSFVRPLAEKILPDRADWLVSLLVPDSPAYGAGPNKMALLAAALGVEVLHRRDSDIRFDCRGDLLVLPGPMEAKVVSQPANTLAVLGLESEERIRVVASGYFGDAALDRRDLFRAGWSFVRRAEDLMASGDTPEAIDHFITNYYLKAPATRYERDFTTTTTDARTWVSHVRGVFMSSFRKCLLRRCWGAITCRRT